MNARKGIKTLDVRLEALKCPRQKKMNARKGIKTSSDLVVEPARARSEEDECPQGH